MANILDYIEENGNRSFNEMDFNEVDGLIFSTLSYADFSGIISLGSIHEKRTPLKKAADLYIKNKITRVEKLNPDFVSDIRELMVKCAVTRRYENIKLISFFSKTDKDRKGQFAALAIEYMPGYSYVGFRGTDNTIIGWREDFAMSYKAVPAQLAAVEFLEYFMNIWSGSIILGGHSKGGNLAMYSSIVLKDSDKRISEVYNYDGPGLYGAVMENENFPKLKERIKSFVPSSSMVGMIFEKNFESMVIKADASGMKQHNPMTWNVEDTSFVPAKKISKKSLVFQDTMKQWIDGLDDESRKEFTTIVFGMMENNGFDTFDDVASKKGTFVVRFIKSLSRLRRPTRQNIRKTAARFLKAGIRGIGRNTFRVVERRSTY